MDRQKRSTQTRFACLVRSSYSGSWRYLDDQGSGDGYRPAGGQIEFFTFCVGPFFQRIIEVSIGTKSAVLPFRRQNAEAVVTKRSKPRPFRFPVSRGTVWRESPPLPRTWLRTITTTPESPGYSLRESNTC